MSDNGKAAFDNSGCKQGQPGLVYVEEAWSPAPFTPPDMVTKTPISNNFDRDRSGGSSSTS